MRPMGPRLHRALRAAALAAFALCWAQQAAAVFTFTALGSARVIMRVGSDNGRVNSVTFPVTGASIGPTQTRVIGVRGDGAPAIAPANGVEIEVETRMPNNLWGNNTMTLLANSSGGLTCVGGSGCGATIIPFTTIGWTSYNLATGTGAGEDIQDGTFNGSGAQKLAEHTTWTGIFGSSVNMSNVLVFHYDSATLYPAGRYTGTVVFTASIL